MDYRCYHLYHNRDQPNMVQYQKSLALLNRVSELSEVELNRFINANRLKNALLNKYDN